MSYQAIQPAAWHLKTQGDQAFVFNETYGDFYASQKDAFAESQYVFIQGANLHQAWQQKSSQHEFVIAETGFGLGVNFCQTLQAWLAQPQGEKPSVLTYISFEKHPFSLEDLHQAWCSWGEIFEGFADFSQAFIAQYPLFLPGVHGLDFPQLSLRLLLVLGDGFSQLSSLEFAADVWFLDGFSPKSNPDLWSPALLKLAVEHSRPECIFVSYAATSQLKKTLQQLGVQLNHRPGFAGKREMTQGMLKVPPLTAKVSEPWFNPPEPLTKPIGEQRIAIIGAGVAGLTTAYVLSQWGVAVEVFEAAPELGAGASGNPAGLILPVLSQDFNPRSSFYFAALNRTLIHLHQLGLAQSLQGSFWLAHHPGLVKRLQQTLASLQVSPQLIQWWDDVSYEIGLQDGLQRPALWLAGGTVSPQLWAKRLMETGGFAVHFNRSVTSISPVEQGHWLVESSLGQGLFDQVVLATGSHFVPVKGVGDGWQGCTQKALGQVSWMDVAQQTPQAPWMQPNLAYSHKGYVIPWQDQLIFGATYDADAQLAQVNLQAHVENWQLLHDKVLKLGNGFLPSQVQGRASFRLSCDDRLPMIGPVMADCQLIEHYGDIWKNPKAGHWPSAGPYYAKGLWVHQGLGSRGLTSAFYGAEILKSLIFSEVLPLSRAGYNQLHPSRCWIKKRIRKHI